MGNICKDPEVIKTKSGKDVCDLRIAVPRGQKDDQGNRISDFMNVQCWEATARFVGTYLTKGDRVAVTGELHERSYTDKDGAKKYVLEVIARNVDSVGGKRGGDAAKDSKGSGRGFEEIHVDDDELPF